MKNCIAILLMFSLISSSCVAQNMSSKASDLLKTMTADQKAKVMYTFDTTERYVWGYVPKNDRKGLSFNEMNDKQKALALSVMQMALSSQAYTKVRSIMGLEMVLKAIEKRTEDDHYRDTGKYFFTIFGQPGAKNVWGWRLDGHHISFNFTSNNNTIVAGTPGFLGANPAVVLSGPQKGLEILHDETSLGLQLVHALTADQLSKAMISTDAPGDIVTTDKRVAMIDHPAGLSYAAMTAAQQQLFMQVLSLYIHRYTHQFAQSMMSDIEKAGLKNMLFSWAGSTVDGVGQSKYYRIQGPTIIIEYDNTQNNANHVHSVVRDLKNDFGGDILLDHYKASHQSKP